MPALPAVDPARLRSLLGTDTRWGRLDLVVVTGSTNDDVVARAASGEPDGAVVIAEHQTGGHGRFERAWVDVPGANLALSVLVRPSRPVSEWGWLSLLAGVAVVRALTSLNPGASARVGLKWPNDVLLDGRKVCGILAASDGVAAVVGVGVDVGLAVDELPVPTATSLALAGLGTDKTALAGAILTALETQVSAWEAGADPRLDYLAVSATVGTRVRVELGPASAVEGQAVGLDDWGGLVVRHDDGTTQAYAAGDVIHLRPPASS